MRFYSILLLVGNMLVLIGLIAICWFGCLDVGFYLCGLFVWGFVGGLVY